MKRFFITLSLLGFISFYSCKEESKNKTVKPPKIVFKHEGNLTLLNSLKNPKKTLEIEIADNDFEHQTGLMYRKKMKTNRGMLFIFNKSEMKSFYMKNTLIPLDIIFIDHQLQIINIAKNTQPLNEQSVYSDEPASYVLEVNGGMSEKWDLRKGDFIAFSRLPKQ